MEEVCSKVDRLCCRRRTACQNPEAGADADTKMRRSAWQGGHFMQIACCSASN